MNETVGTYGTTCDPVSRLKLLSEENSEIRQASKRHMGCNRR
jgi:hypothetical protein